MTRKDLSQELAEDTGEGAAWMLKAHVYGLTGLGTVLVTAKAVGLTVWPWWLVTAPFWFPWTLVAVVLAGVVIAALVSALLSGPPRDVRNGSDKSQVRNKIDV